MNEWCCKKLQRWPNFRLEKCRNELKITTTLENCDTSIFVGLLFSQCGRLYFQPATWHVYFFLSQHQTTELSRKTQDKYSQGNSVCILENLLHRNTLLVS